jgi:hypothetical protein
LEIFLAVAGGGVLLIGLARLISPDRFIDESWNFHRPRGSRGVLATVIGVLGWLALIIGVQCAIGIATSGFGFHGPGGHGLGGHGFASHK